MLKLFQNERVERLSSNQKQDERNPQLSLYPRMGQQAARGKAWKETSVPSLPLTLTPESDQPGQCGRFLLRRPPAGPHSTSRTVGSGTARLLSLCLLPTEPRILSVTVTVAAN